MTAAFKLISLARHFAAANPQYEHQDGAFSRCVEASERFALICAAEGFRPVILQCEEFTGELPETAHSFWKRADPQRMIHQVVRVGGRVYDWTARQFDAEAAFPLVTKERLLNCDWRLIEPMRTYAVSGVTIHAEGLFGSPRERTAA